MKRSLSRQGGFTLLEIMLVVAIIMVLLGLAIGKMSGALDMGKTARAQADVQTYKTAIMMYETKSGMAPSSTQGLAALVTKPEGDPKPRNWSKQMDSITIDPWGTNYYYENPGKHNPTGYDLYSAGPDRKPGTDDDIGNW